MKKNLVLIVILSFVLLFSVANADTPLAQAEEPNPPTEDGGSLTEPDNPLTPEPNVPDENNETEEPGEETPNPEEEPDEGALPELMQSPIMPTAGPVPTGSVVVSDISIKLADGTDINEATEVEPNAQITISFTFSVPDASLVHAGDTFSLRLPDEIVVDTGNDPTYVVEIPLQGTDQDIAYVTLTDGSQEILVTFTDLIDEGYESIDDAYFGIYCYFNEGSLGNGGERPIIFEYDGASTIIKVNFKENKVETDILKEVDDQTINTSTGTYEQTWKITLNSVQSALTDLVLEDILPDGLEYLGYQFEGENRDTEPAGWTVSYQGDTVQFSHSGDTAETIEIYLYTQVKDLRKFDEDPDHEHHVLVPNEAIFNAKDQESGTALPQLEADASVSLYAGQVIKGSSYNGKDLEIPWTLLINEKGETLSNLQLYDTIPAGLALDPNSIVIQTGGGATLSVGAVGSGADVTYSYSTNSDDSATYTFFFPTPTKDTYTMTYLTEIVTEDFFTATGNLTFTNEAYLGWGNGNYSGNSSGTVSGGYNMLYKEGTTYNPQTQEITWNIWINRNFYDVNGDAELTDDFMPGTNSKQKQDTPMILRVVYYTKDAPTTAVPMSEGNGDYSYTENNDDTFTLTLPAGSLKERMVQITFTTTVRDMELVYSNDTQRYHNHIAMCLEGRDYETSGSWNIQSRVLRKTNGYDYSTRTATWRLEINPFALSNIGEVTIEDSIDPDLELVGVYLGAVDPANLLSAGQDYSYDSTTRQFSYTFEEGELEGVTANLYLVTKVSDDFFLLNDDDAAITNKANIVISVVEKDSDDESTVEIPNTMIGKGGTLNPDDGTVTWEVLINSNAVDWDLSAVVLTDDLPDGLQLDVDSVRLVRYALNAQGNEISEDEVSFNATQAISYDLESNLFTFTFPAGMDGSYRYRLFFDTDVLASGTYENKIQLTGFGEVDEEGKTTVVISGGDDWAGAIASRKAKITLHKSTEERDTPLAGAVFELRNSAGVVLETQTTAEDGTISFATWLSHETDYYLYEVEAPEGYKLLTEPLKVYILKGDDGKAVSNSLTYATTNEAEPKNPGGENPGGENPGGENPGGETPGGGNPGGGNPGGENPGGENPGGENPGGENPGGENPGGENPGGENPGGENPGGETPGGENPGGETPGGENPDPGKENPQTGLSSMEHVQIALILTAALLSLMIVFWLRQQRR